MFVMYADLHSECADIVAYSDYYPYGMILPNRSGSAADDYRYGFQGQEMDDEIKGEGNSVNYKYRMHDPRIGRFFAVDPLTNKYPKWSPYQFGGNQVIHAVELEGLESSDDKSGTENATEMPGENVISTERNYKLNPYNDSRSHWSFTLGQQPLSLSPKHIAARKAKEGDGSYHAGEGYGVLGRATSGTQFYTTESFEFDQWTEGNHSFGMSYWFENWGKIGSSHLIIGGLYTKQKIRGLATNSTGYNLEAPASLTFYASYRFGTGQKKGRDLSFGIAPELGVGPTLAVIRANEIKNSNIRPVGLNAAFNIKLDVSIRHFSVYMRAQSTVFHISKLDIEKWGKQPSRDYGIALLTIGVVYNVHLTNPFTWKETRSARKSLEL